MYNDNSTHKRSNEEESKLALFAKYFNRVFKILKKYPCNYTISFLGQYTNTTGTKYQIAERPSSFSKKYNKRTNSLKGLCLNGGSIFEVKIKGPQTIRFCHLKDKFNGTYEIRCPMHEKGSKLIVKVTSINYFGYVSTSYVPIMTFQMKMADGAAIHFSKYFPNHVQILQSLSISTCECIWYVSDPSQALMTVNGIHWNLLYSGLPMKNMSRLKLKDMFKHFNKVIFIGDSNLRYGSYYLLQKLQILDSSLAQTRRAPFSIGQFHYFWAPMANNVAGVLSFLSRSELLLSNDTLKPNLILVNCGQWERNKLNQYTMGIEYVIEQLQKLINLKDVKSEVLWIGSTPVPGSIRGLNTWIKKRMSAIPVKSFDVSSIVYPFNEQLVCGRHYLCVVPKSNTVLGNVGIALQEVLYRHIYDEMIAKKQECI